MTQLFENTTHLLEGSSQLVTLLERHRNAIPSAEEELAAHRALRHTLDDQHRRGELALSAWREALSRRWECEVQAQRVYMQARHRLHEYYSDDPTYERLVAPSHPGGPATASDLLDNLRRLEASVALLMPHPPFADTYLEVLRSAADDLATAIDWTHRCEAERRTILFEQRVANNLYQRACEKTRRLLAGYLGDAPAVLAS